MDDLIADFLTETNESLADLDVALVKLERSPDDQATPAVKAQFPFREARIEVVDVPGKPGSYRAVAFLRPHFQLDELTISLRLVAELPGPAQR